VSERTALLVQTPRLNPFAFPSETTLRFILLVIFVVCGSARSYGEFSGPDPAINECVSKLLSEMPQLKVSDLADAERNAEIVRRNIAPLVAQCGALFWSKLVWTMVGVGLVLLAAAIVYGLHPIVKLKTGRLEPISSSQLPELEHELQSLVETAGLPGTLRFVWNPLAIGMPVVFGHRGKYYVALTSSFITQYFYGDRESFREIMLHELAHLQNGDVHKTYFTISLWLAYLATTLVPCLLAAFWRLTTVHWSDAASLLLSSLLWTGVVILSGLAVLRSREYYADVRASVWSKVARMDRVLAALSAPVGKGWRRYLRFHPDPRERGEVVEDPSRLFGLSFAEAFGIGIAAWSIVGVIPSLFLPFWPADAWRAFIFLAAIQLIVPAVVFVFAIGAIGIGVWRNAFACLLKGDQPSKGTGWLGAAFVAGAIPGLVMFVFEEQSLPFPALLAMFQLNALICIALLVGCLLIFRWISEAVSAWFEVVLQSRSPKPLLLVTVATALVVTVMTFGMAYFVVMFSFLATPWRQAGANWIYVYGLVAGLPILIASLAIWAFPLAAPWWRKPVMAAGLAPWIFLDGAPPKIPQRKPVHLRGALSTGVTMGLLFWLAWELLHFRQHLPAGIGDGIHSAFESLFELMSRIAGDRSFLLVASAACFQALAAAIVAARATRLNAVCGLFAASVAGLVMVAGNLIFVGIGSQTPATQTAVVAVQFMGLGVIVALPTVVGAAWFAEVARRAFARAGFNEANGQGRPLVRSLLSKGSFVALCVVVGIGMTARLREVVLQMQEVNAYRAAAERGDREAQNKLGVMYARGQLVARDDAQAVSWWRRAAEQGDAAAQSNLASMFFMGRGVAQDDALAVEWFRRAAEQGHAGGEFGLGVMYALGRGVANDDSLALQWFRQAADQGNADAQNHLGLFCALGRGTPADDTAAVKWFRAAAEQGHAEAQNNLGAFYALGRGTAHDDGAAVGWLRRAAEQGHAAAQNNLGQMYQQGRALPKDDAQALRWFRSAAEKGHADAQFHLGQMFEKGEGVAKDDTQAILWLGKAATNGHSEAKNHLQVMCDSGLGAACSR
jgi:TPR repeat protein/Zn-dependent protease with chaperone function